VREGDRIGRRFTTLKASHAEGFEIDELLAENRVDPPSPSPTSGRG